MAEDLPFAEKIKTLQVMSRTGEGTRVRDVHTADGQLAKETREGDPDGHGYITHTESGSDRVDVVVQPNPVRVVSQVIQP